MTTLGDVSRAQLTQIGGTGVFVSALREALLGGEVDLAVHSLKDLPTAPDGRRRAGRGPAPRRPAGRAGRAGRRQARRPAARRQDRHRLAAPGRAAARAPRPTCDCVPIRGNAGTRLGKVSDGELDAVVLAYAGLARIGRVGAVTEVFEPDEMLPAPGQGALAVECRADDAELAALLRPCSTTRPARPR